MSNKQAQEQEKSTLQQADETKQEVQGAVNVVKNYAKKNYVGAAKEGIKLLKNEKTREKLLIGIIVGIMIPVLIAALFMTVVSSITDIVEGVISTIGNFFSGVGDWFTRMFKPDIGKMVIMVDDEKFQEVKQSLASQGISASSAQLTDECLKVFLLAQYKTQYPDDVILLIEISEEEKKKIDARGRGISIVKEAGTYYLKSEGCIQLYRPEFTTDKLRYCEKGTLDEYVNGTKSFDDVKDYYTIDSQGNLIVPQKKAEKVIEGKEEKIDAMTNLNNEDSFDWTSFDEGNSTKETITPLLQTIPYQSNISGYTMPYEFLTTLTTFTQNSEFGVAVANLISFSTINLNILDNSITNEKREIIQYNNNTEIEYRVGIEKEEANEPLEPEEEANEPINSEIDYSEENSEQIVFETDPSEDSNIQIELETDSSGNPNSKVVWEKDLKYHESNQVYIKRKTTKTTEYSSMLQVAKATTWLVNKETSYSYEEGQPQLDEGVEENPQISDKKTSEKYNISLNQAEQDNYISLQNLYETNGEFSKFIDEYYSGISSFRYEVDNNSNSDIMPTYINNMKEDEQTKTAYYVSKNKYNITNVGPAEDNTDAFLSLLVKNSRGKKEFVYYTLDDGTKKAPGATLLSAPDMFFEILASNSKTANLENAMRYIMYRMTDDDSYGVTDINSVFMSVNAKSVGADYSVTDESLFIKSKEDLITAIKSLGQGPEAQQNLIDNADAFLEMQLKYKVNATLAISVAIAESSAGTNGFLIEENTYNWTSIQGESSNGQYITDSNGTKWCKFSSFREATLAFGELISGDTYCGSGKVTISQIGNKYCPNTDEYPTQADTWISNTKASMTRILRAAGVDLSSYSAGDASGVVEFALQQVGKGINDVLPIGTTSSDGRASYFQNEWCAMFVTYCFDSCGLIPTVLEHGFIECNAETEEWVTSGKLVQKEFYTPKAGDIIFYENEWGRCHTGIVTDCDGTYVYTVEGNAGPGGWWGATKVITDYNPVNDSSIYGYYIATGME